MSNVKKKLLFVTFLLIATIFGMNLAFAKTTQSVGDILYPISQNGSWGYINKTGKVIAKPIYYKADEFYDGVGIVVSTIKDKILGYTPWNNRYGVIDVKGKILIKPSFFTDISRFNENITNAQYYNEKTEKYCNCLINKNGKILCTLAQDIDLRIPLYRNNNAPLMSSGLLLAYNKSTNLYGYINTKGKWAIQPNFDSAYIFSGGLAYVVMDGKKGYINKTGKMVIDASEYSECGDFYDGFAVVAKSDSSLNPKYGYIDTKGNLEIPLQYDNAYNFSEGYAKVITYTESHKPNIFYIDKTGTNIFNGKFINKDADDMKYSQFSDGYAKLYSGRNGYIDKAGEIVIKPDIPFSPTSYQYIYENFRNGIAKVKMKNGEIGYINKTGKYIWKPIK
jgi:hypothetical protein